MDRIRTIFCPFPPRANIKDALNEHIDVVGAIKQGDSAKAERIMRAHIRSYGQILKQMV